MKFLHFLTIACLLSLPSVSAAEPPQNTLSPSEKAQGWRLLWDGHSQEGWRSAKKDGFPDKGWEMKDGVMTVLSSGGGGDIVTRERFEDFELTVDFRITEGANSGIKYFVQTGGQVIGLEFQILDDVRHPDAKRGRDGNRTMSSLYDLIAADAGKKVNPVGEWNTARIVAKDGRVAHWLNGEKVVDFKRDSRAFRKLVEMSKYKGFADFGEWEDGHILLQDHGNRVSFRNIKIRTL